MVANICNNLYNHSIFLFVTFHAVYSIVFIIYYFLFPVLFSSNLHPLSTLLLYQSYSIVFIIYYFLFPVLFSFNLHPLSTLLLYQSYSIVSSDLLLLSFSFFTFFPSHPLPFIPSFSHLFPPSFLLFSFLLYPPLTSPNSRPPPPPFPFLFHLLFPSLYAHSPSLPFPLSLIIPDCERFARSFKINWSRQHSEESCCN